MIIATPASVSLECGCDLQAQQQLVPIAEALAAIMDGVGPVSGTEILPVAQARGRVIAAPVASEMPLPRFDNSAMDGYAIHGDDISRAAPLRLTDRIAAGCGQIAALAPAPRCRF